MKRFKHSLIGAVILCLCLVLNCTVGAEEQPRPLSGDGQSGQRFITIDFDNVDIQLFIKYISELTGKNFIVDKAVQGNVTILSPTKISEDEAYRVFQSVLEVHGFTTVEAGSAIKIMPSARARSENVEMLSTGASANPQDKIVTQLVLLKHSSPDDIKKVLAPLVSQTSVLISHEPSGMLIITETMSNIQKLLSIIKVLDVESREAEVAYIPLENASADTIAKILTNVYQKNTTQRRAGAAGGSADSVIVVPYERVNAVIVLASANELIRVKKLVAVLDTEVPRAEGDIRVYYLQNATATEMAKVLNDLPEALAKDGVTKGKTAAISKDVTVMADEETNALIIRASKDEYAVLEDVIKQLDIPRRMVYLEALIMEVSATKNFDVGVEWVAGGMSSSGRGQVVSGFNNGTSLLGGINATTPSLASGFTLGFLNQGGIRIGNTTFANLGAVVNAFKSDSDVNVISTPQILTMDNKKAEISVGENVPFISRQDNTSGSTTGLVFNSFEYKDVATKLSITPHINQSDVLRLEIDTEVTRIKEIIDNAPTTFKRTASTTVILNDKNTVVIGGIIGHDATDGDSKIPILGDIPLLGWLFKTHSTTNNKTNMFIFITPHIVRNPANIAAVTLKKEGEMGLVLPAVRKELHKEEDLEDAIRLTRQGYEKLRSGELETAKDFFSEALAIDPANPYALMNMGVVYEKEGYPKKALQMYQAVVSGGSDAVSDSSSDPLKNGVPLKTLAKESIDRILRSAGTP